MSVRLGEQRIGLGLEGLHGIGTSGKPERRLFESGEMHNCMSELSRVAALLAVHAAPSVNDFPGLLGVIVDGGLGVGGGVFTEELSAEEARLDEHRADAGGGDLRGKRLHPPFDAELRGGIGTAEQKARDSRS